MKKIINDSLENAYESIMNGLIESRDPIEITELIKKLIVVKYKQKIIEGNRYTRKLVGATLSGSSLDDIMTFQHNIINNE